MFKGELKMFWGISRDLEREKSQYDGEKPMAPSNYEHYEKLTDTYSRYQSNLS